MRKVDGNHPASLNRAVLCAVQFPFPHLSFGYILQTDMTLMSKKFSKTNLSLKVYGGFMLDLDNDGKPVLSGTSNFPWLICAQISIALSLNGLRAAGPESFIGTGDQQTAWKIAAQKLSECWILAILTVWVTLFDSGDDVLCSDTNNVAGFMMAWTKKPSYWGFNSFTKYSNFCSPWYDIIKHVQLMWTKAIAKYLISFWWK